MPSRLRRWLPLPLLLAALAPAAGADEPPRSFTVAASGDILIHGAVARAAAAYAGDGGYDLMFGEGGNESDGNRGLFGGPGTDYIYGGYGADLCEGETMLGCETP